MIEIPQLRRLVEGHPLVREIDQVPKGHLRIETGLHYPDGTSIEVFLVEDAPLLDGYKLSDLGQTMGWLLNLQIKPWLSAKRRALLDDAIQTYGAILSGGAIELRLESLDRVAEGVIRLGQACLRTSDLIFTRRASLQSSFQEQVEEILADVELPYQPNAELVGRYGTVVRVDFLVAGEKTKSSVLTMSSGTPSQAHNLANEIFRRWYDLDVPERPEQRVTIFDDERDVYRDEDLRRLNDLSVLVALSDRQTLQDVLIA